MFHQYSCSCSFFYSPVCYTDRKKDVQKNNMLALKFDKTNPKNEKNKTLFTQRIDQKRRCNEPSKMAFENAASICIEIVVLHCWLSKNIGGERVLHKKDTK